MSSKVVIPCEDAQKRAKEFLSVCGDPNTVPVKVYNPFTPNKLSEVQLIRELSCTLQAKKVEEDRKAEAAAAEEAQLKEAQKEVVHEVSKEESEKSKQEIVTK